MIALRSLDDAFVAMGAGNAQVTSQPALRLVVEHHVVRFDPDQGVGWCMGVQVCQGIRVCLRPIGVLKTVRAAPGSPPRPSE